MALVLLFLAACADGTAPEARQGQVEDAQATSVVADLQATYTANLLNGSPSPGSIIEPDS